ncbi:hypothetical protein Bca4012_081762 [Brassica carinata]
MSVELLVQQPGREHLPVLHPNPRPGYTTWFQKSSNGISRSINQMMYSMLASDIRVECDPSEERELWFHNLRSKNSLESGPTETVRRNSTKAMDSYTKRSTRGRQYG